jgi:hypothetical protein
MKTELPYWVQLLQALSTPAIALLAIVIGYAQWRTAHQRAVVDLFEKRMKIYEDIRNVIGEVARAGSVTNENINAYFRAIDQTDILFGPEVTAYLDVLRRTLSGHHLAEQQIAHPRSEKERHEAIDRQSRAFERVTAFYTDFPKLIKPYVQMHQRMPRL